MRVREALTVFDKAFPAKARAAFLALEALLMPRLFQRSETGLEYNGRELQSQRCIEQDKELIPKRISTSLKPHLRNGTTAGRADGAVQLVVAVGAIWHALMGKKADIGQRAFTFDALEVVFMEH